jgi:protein involved in polysaccharide export with SLBB domain
MKDWIVVVLAAFLGAAGVVIQSAPAADPPKAATAPATTKARQRALQSGDRLVIRVWDLQEPGREWVKETTIDGKGKVNILYLGDVEIAGLTMDEAVEKIAKSGIEKHVLLPNNSRVEIARVAVASRPAR